MLSTPTASQVLGPAVAWPIDQGNTPQPLPSASSGPSELNGEASLAVLEALIETFGLALHTYGCSAPRLEDALGQLTRRLGGEGQFFSTPTAIFASLGRGGARKTVLIRTEPGEVNLEKLCQLDGLMERVCSGDLPPQEAAHAVNKILAAPPRYGAGVVTASFALTSSCAAYFFGGSAVDLLVAGGLGLLVGLLSLGLGRLGHRLPTAPRIFESLAGIVTAGVAFALAHFGLPLQAHTVILASLIVLIPGLTVTVAMNELATRNLVSGSARLAGAVLVLLTMGFGVALGSGLAQQLPDAWLGIVELEQGSATLASWLPRAWGWGPLADALPLAAAAAGFIVLFSAPARYGLWIFATAAIALVASRGGSAALGPELGAAAGALAVGLAGNLFARTFNRPSTVLQIPGLMLLVPGSVGFRGVSSLLAQDALAGVQGAFTMTLLAAALVSGLLMANVLLPSHRAL